MGIYEDLLNPNSDLGAAIFCNKKYGLAQCDGVGMSGSAVYASVRVKVYDGMLGEVMIASEPVFKVYDGGDDFDGFDDGGKRNRRRKDSGSDSESGRSDLESSTGSLESSTGSLERSKRRARKAVFDYAMSNSDLDLFITLTLSPEEIDRTDYKAIVKRLNAWLDHRVRKHGLKYVLVAEYHKDGKAIHFHGLINSSAVKIVDSGKKDRRGHKVYNLPEWKLGYTTAVKVYGGKTRGGVCKYICKYISKQGDKVGGRWYYSGGELARPEYEYALDTAPLRAALDKMDDMEHYTYTVEPTGKTFEIYSRKWD